MNLKKKEIGLDNTMGSTPQETRFIFLDSIMKENNVSSESIYECMEKKKNEIESIEEIFHLNDELAVKKRMVLLSLISRSRAKENLEYYKDAENISMEFNNQDIDNYGVLIIAALMSNILFFVRACNWHGLITRDVKRIIEIKKRIGDQSERFSEYLEKENKIINIAESFPYETINVKNTMIPLKIHPADRNYKLDIIKALYSKKTKCISISCKRELQDKIFTLWLFEKDREYDPVPICLSLDGKGNLQGEIKNGIPETGKYIILAEPARYTKPKIKIVKTISNHITLRFPEPKDDALAADSTGFASFLQTPLAYNDIDGTLYFKGNDQQEVFLMFRFNEEQKTIPFELEVCFTTKRDHKKYVIAISANNRIEGSNIIKSDIVSGIHYSDGIEGEYTVTIKPPNVS